MAMKKSWEPSASLQGDAISNVDMAILKSDAKMLTLHSERNPPSQLKSVSNSDFKAQKSFLSSYRSKNIETDLKTLNFIKQKLKCVSNSQVIPAFEKFYADSKELSRLFESVKAVHDACYPLKIHSEQDENKLNGTESKGSKSGKNVWKPTYFEIWERLKGLIITRSLTHEGDKESCRKQISGRKFETSQQKIQGEDSPTVTRSFFKPGSTKLDQGTNLRSEIKSKTEKVLSAMLDENSVAITGKGALSLFKNCQELLKMLDLENY